MAAGELLGTADGGKGLTVVLGSALHHAIPVITRKGGLPGFLEAEEYLVVGITHQVTRRSPSPQSGASRCKGVATGTLSHCGPGT